jgi:hypothetical protein
MIKRLNLFNYPGLLSDELFNVRLIANDFYMVCYSQWIMTGWHGEQ